MMNRIAIASLIFVGSVLSASANTIVLKDVRNPGGHARSEATKLADARSCGADGNNWVANSKLPAVLKCMSARGWAIARFERDRSQPIQQTYTGPSITVSVGAGVDNSDMEAQMDEDVRHDEDMNAAIDRANNLGP
jgi:hypothetical protein